MTMNMTREVDTGKYHLQTWALACVLVFGSSLCQAAEAEVTPEQMVSAIEDVFGVTPGKRRNHIKGICAAGEFVGMPKAAAYSRSALFSGRSVPVVARFSLAGGNPKAPDVAKSPRGMALEFRLPKREVQHMTMLNVPVFGAANPGTFFDMFVAMKPDPATGKPDPEKMKAFKETHPDSHALGDFMAHNNPPLSYGNSAYFSIHTFKFVNSKNKTTMVRWRFAPRDGEKQLSDGELKSMAANFLEQALITRIKEGPLRWDMLITLGEPGDAVDNPTLAWPANRKTVKVGTLTITSVASEEGAKCENINFDPLVMSDGIEPTNDPILQFRSPAYAISFAKRTGGI